ncbi:MAG: hypothetical protein JST59_02350 [Actinobacteria bacterium]|nr:hypothetical protein [Actinomycetota bacterium]
MSILVTIALRICNLQLGKQLSLFYGHKGWVWCLKASPERKLIVSASVDCNIVGDFLMNLATIRLWDSSTQTCTATLVGHDREISGLAANFEENRIVSASFDASVKIWDLRTRKCMATLHGHKERLTRCDMNDDSIVTACFDGEIRLWKFK